MTPKNRSINTNMLLNKSGLGDGIMPSKNYVRNMQMLHDIKNKLPINQLLLGAPKNSTATGDAETGASVLES